MVYVFVSQACGTFSRITAVCDSKTDVFRCPWVRVMRKGAGQGGELQRRTGIVEVAVLVDAGRPRDGQQSPSAQWREACTLRLL